ncbi:alkaline phosphatase family protein [Candidatus Nitrososphaera sp. FF02]|uniref:alkaline phosphatase family protein n=1 Tax=Candidatus Nitrososphaera sp. FF02 TaxID=3398226 RepID=UPI0039EA60A8
MKKVTIAICIDALRHDFVNENDSPFLYDLAKKGTSSTIEGPLSYEEAPMWFAGLHPETSDKWFLYWYSPSTSSFSKIPVFGLDLSKYKKTRFLINIMCSRIFKFPYGSASFMPLYLLKYFDFSEKLAPWNNAYSTKPTLFSMLKERKMSWLFIGIPGSDQRTSAILTKFKASYNNQDFIWLHFSETDSTEHKFGPMSKERRSALKNIDLVIEEIFQILESRNDVVNALIFGDHGCLEVKNTVNILERIGDDLLRSSKHKFRYFLDSTTARFWFEDKDIGSRLEERLRNVPYGRFLTMKELTMHHCNFSHSKYGNLIWIADPGSIILPNFWDGYNSPKGMHGYLPIHQDCDGKLIINHKSSSVREGKVKSVDIFPTILQLMGLPIPDSSEGKSILDER